MGKLWAILDLFRKGSVVTEPRLWKDRTALTLALTALILAAVKAAKGLGYDLPISETDAATLAAGFAVAVGLCSTYATSSKVGILPAKPLHADLPTIDPHIVDRPAIDRVNRVDAHERDYPRDSGG